jgi:zinc transport system ATP-binding protein
MSKTNAIEARDVCLSIGRHTILDSISFAIPEGQYVGIVGPNGAGKTTLLKVILGLIRPTKGEVHIFGESPFAARRHGRIGYVPQRIAQADIPFPVSVKEMVSSGRTSAVGLGRWHSKHDHEAIDEAMNRANVAHMRDRLVGTLSGGERQRVFIARALAADPQLLILDEPATGVDMAAKEEFYALLKTLNADLGLTIVFVSHDMEVMTSEVAFVLALNQKLICHCSSHTFLSEDTIERLYGKSIKSHPPHLHL